MKIFDTHAHYSDAVYDSDREQLFKKMFATGVSDVTLIGASLNESKKEKELALKYAGIAEIPRFYFTIGDHPDEIPKYDPESLEGVKYLKELEELAMKDGKVSALAVGEIGLDYHGDFKTDTDYKNQIKWFISEISLAKKLKLPIVVHSRDACKDTFETIKENARELRGIIHCFSYEKETALDYINLGYFIGIGGVVTFKNGRKLKEVVEAIPIESIVTETDAPWLSPVPHRGERNESSNIRFVIEEIATIKGLDIEKTAEILYNNALTVYNLH